MRWENLFDDLAGQLEHELDAEEIDVQGEEERLRIGRLTLRDRLVALLGDSPAAEPRALRVQLDDGTMLTLALRSVGRDWIMGELVTEASQGTPPSSTSLRTERSNAAQCIIPFHALGAMAIDTEVIERSIAPAAPLRLADRLGLTFVLRDLARRRRAVDLAVSWGTVHGTIDRVSRDHVDLAEHEAGSPRRQSAVSTVKLIPLAQVKLVRL